MATEWWISVSESDLKSSIAWSAVFNYRSYTLLSKMSNGVHLCLIAYYRWHRGRETKGVIERVSARVHTLAKGHGLSAKCNRPAVR